MFSHELQLSPTTFHLKQFAIYGIRYCSASGNSPAAPVLARPVFQGKNASQFLQIVRTKQSSSVIFGFDRLIILSYNG